MSRDLSLNHLFYSDRDWPRHQGRIVWNMQVVAEQHAECVLAGFKGYFSRCGAITEVNVIGVGRHRRPQFRQVRIDQEMVMARIRLIVTRFYDADAFDPKLDADRVGYRVTIRRCYEKNLGAVGRDCTKRGSRRRIRVRSRQ